MKVAKRFRWEAAHRLPWHEGDCSNVHGHSYRMVVELEGEPDERGMLVDFQIIKQILTPLVDAWDHALLVSKGDDELLRVIRETDWKHAVLPFDTTAENLSTYAADYLCEKACGQSEWQGVRKVRVRIAETETCYAEAERSLEAGVSPTQIATQAAPYFESAERHS